MAGFGNDSDGYVGLGEAVFSVVSNTNLGLGTSTGFGSGQVVFSMANVTTAPVSLGFAGGIFYVESGHLKYMGQLGTVTTVASA